MKKTLHLIHLTSFILLLLWFHTALDKFADLWTFGVNLGRQPLPQWSIKPLTYAVPVTEVAIGVLLFIPYTRKLGFWLSTALLLVFSVYIALGLSKVLGHVPCSCSKVIAHLSWSAHLWLNLALLVFSSIGILHYYPAARQKIKHIYHILLKKIYAYLGIHPPEDSTA